MSGPTDWILRYIKTTFFLIADQVEVKEAKDRQTNKLTKYKVNHVTVVTSYIAMIEAIIAYK